MTRRRRINGPPTRESRHTEFKDQIDVTSTGGWCELLKDIVAIANSGGGQILVGLDNAGNPTGWDPTLVLAVDHAVVVDKIAKYTGEQFADLEIREEQVQGKRCGHIQIGATSGAPLIFERPGDYVDALGKPKQAFGKGTVYFRHGAKSEPGNSRDLNGFFKRELQRTRRSWLSGIRKVVAAPPGSEWVIAPPGATETAPGSHGVRLVDDPKAPAYRQISPDVTHPYRAKEVIWQFNSKSGESPKINSFDVLAVRKTHPVETKRAWFYKPRFGSSQYSDAFVDWLLARAHKDKNFFVKARGAYRVKSR